MTAGRKHPLDQEGRSKDAPSFERAFAFFNEVGIISQLATALMAKALPDGIHPSHFDILNHLYRTGDGKTPVRIASAMQVTKATMTHSLKVLEDNGFIEVRPNPQDARGKLIYLTEMGADFRNRAIADVMQKFGPLLTEEHLAAMTRALPDLTELRKYLDANR